MAYKNEKNKCNNMTKHAETVYFRKVAVNMGSKLFWNTIKLLFTGIITNASITLEENGIFKNDLKEKTEVFNNYYINILETTSGKRPSSVDNSEEDINKTVKSLNANKATGLDEIPLKPFIRWSKGRPSQTYL